MTFNDLCKKISEKKNTELLCEHGNGRIIYSIKKPTHKQCEILKTGNFPFFRWANTTAWEIKEGYDVTGDKDDSRLMLIKTGR